MSMTAGARWRALAAMGRADRWRWAALAVLVALGAALALIGPLIVRSIVDEATTGTTTATLTRLAAMYLVIAAATQMVAVAVVWYATDAAWRVTNRLRMQMARHVLGLDHEFHRHHTPGELIQRVDGDVTSLSDLFGKVVPKAAGALVLVLGMVIVLAVLDWRLAIGMVVYLGVSFGIIVKSRHRAVVESSEEMGALGRMYGGIEERLTASEDLRSNGAANHAAWRFVEESADAMASGLRRERAFLRMWWFVQGAVSAGWVIVLVVGAALVSGDVITVGTAFLMYQYVLLISRPLEEVVHELETVQKASGAMVRVLDLLGLQSQVSDDGILSPPAGPLSIEMCDVDFEYGEDQPVLHGVNLTVGPGRSVGIVGRTGSGKTTFSRLVLRLVEPTSGTLRLGGVSIGDISMAELRHRVALVPQEVELFAGTVRDNVAMFDDGPSDDDVIESLRRVGLDALADGGIHRSLGAAGTGLSAGEAQLLALARVWLRNPDLLVLDEATARVDPTTERQLEAAINGLMVGRTTLVIAHRLSTLRSVDDIVVFDHGRITESGERAALTGDDESRFHRLLTLALESEQLASSARESRGPSA